MEKPEERELEARLIGGLLADPEKIPQIIEIIGDKRLFWAPHQKIYDCMVNLVNRKSEVNSIIVSSDLPDDASREALINCLGYDDWNSTPAYARILVESHIRKSLYDFGKEASFRAGKSSNQEDAFELIDWAESRLFKIANSITRKNFVSSEVAVDDTIRYIISAAHSDYCGITTGFPSVDSLLGGIQSTDLAILAGRPSTGKSAFALEIALHEAALGTPVGFFTLEMSIPQLISRAISKATRIPAHRISLGRVSNEELVQIQNTKKTLSGLPIYWEDCPALSVSELRAKARRLKHERDIGLFIVDYLQLISGNRKDTREQEISSISRTLKGLAKELSTPVLCLSQLSRASEIRVDKKPVLSDLRDSGAIEQDADIVIFVHSSSLLDDWRDILISKHRNGPLGERRLRYIPEYTEFRE